MSCTLLCISAHLKQSVKGAAHSQPSGAHVLCPLQSQFSEEIGTGEKRTELWACSVVSTCPCCGLPLVLLHTVTVSDGDWTENILPKETGLMPPNSTGHVNTRASDLARG